MNSRRGLRQFHSRQCIGLSAFAGLLLVLLSLPAKTDAQMPSRFGPMPANWEGIYSGVGDYIYGNEFDLSHRDQLDGLHPLNPDHGGVARAHLQPWATAEMNSPQPYATVDDIGAVCGPSGIFRHPTVGFPYMLMQAPGMVLLISLDIDQVGIERIYLADHHPDNILPTWDGDSIGHWEGDTLVVDTIGYNDKSWLASELEPHTEELHVVRRIRLVKDGKFLEIYTTVDDRKALVAAYSFSRYYIRSTFSFEQKTNRCNDIVGAQADWLRMRRETIQHYEDGLKTAGKAIKESGYGPQ